MSDANVPNNRKAGRVSDLVAGSTTTRDVYTERGVLLLSRGSTISEPLIQRLIRSRVETIFFDEPSAVLPEAPPAILAPTPVVAPAPAQEDSIPYRYISERIQGIYEDQSYPKMVGAETLAHSRDLLDSVFDFGSSAEPSYNPKEIQRVATTLRDEIVGNRTAMMNLMKLDQFDTYTTNHSLNVAILATSFAAFLGYEGESLERITIGALLHDIGKIRVGAEIVRKQGPLNEEERALMKRHPEFSREIILQRGGVPRPSVVYAFQHHERMHGNGYPLGLLQHQIMRESFILAICDIYDAITSIRSYDRSHSPHLAVYRIMEAAEKEVPKELVSKFAAFMTVLPTGSTVRLDTGEIAIVIRPNRSNSWKPVIKIVTGPGGDPVDGDLLDLTFDSRKILFALDMKKA